MDENLGFGEVEECLSDVGVSCEECKYRDACVEDNVHMEKIAEDKFLEELVEL